MHASVMDVVCFKGRTVHTIRPENTVREAVDKMAQFNVGALVVVRDAFPIGMFSERDVLWRIVHESRSPEETPVHDVMSPYPVIVRPTTGIGEAMRLITERRVRHLPIVERDELVGLVSIGDLTNWVTRDLQIHVGELASYIHGPCVRPTMAP